MAELRSLASALMVATTVILLSGCGLFVPQPHEFYEPGNSDAIFLNTIVNNIKCELKKGAYESLAYLGNNPEAAWLRQWGAKVDLTFTTGETGGFNPSVVLTLLRRFLLILTSTPLLTRQGWKKLRLPMRFRSC